MKAKVVYFSGLLILFVSAQSTYGQLQTVVHTMNLRLEHNTSHWLIAGSHNSTRMHIAPIKSGSTAWGQSTDFYSDGTVLHKGNVNIGTHNSGYYSLRVNGHIQGEKLTIAGNIHAREVRVTANAGADFVFEDDYQLRPLAELEQFVQENKHLPEIAPAAEMVKEGVKTGEFQIQLLQKIEELTLYVITQEKRIAALEAENQRLSDQ